MATTNKNERPTANEKPSPPVDSKTVQGRRQLHFTSLDEVLADAEKLVASPRTRTLGNWSIGRILAHLARAMNLSLDGVAFKARWFVRLYGRIVKRRVLKCGLSPGFKLPKDMEGAAYPTVASPREALDMLCKAVDRMRNERATGIHPLYGKLTHDEWTLLHLRHAELHLSFVLLS